MRLAGLDVLETAIKRHTDARAWVEAVGRAEWQSIDDVRQNYPSADGVKLPSETVVTVFNVRGNRYRLLTTINYPAQMVRAREFLTHAEYSKQLWKARY